MTLTQQEIEKIEREVKEKYSCPYTTEDLRSNDAEYVAHINRSISDTILLQIGYKDAATKYLTQLKEERERSKKLLDLLTDINKSLYVGEDLKDGEILDWYMRVIDTITGEIETAITEYKNNNQ